MDEEETKLQLSKDPLDDDDEERRFEEYLNDLDLDE
jgi:hypothetical protein